MVVRIARSARTVWRQSSATPMPTEGESGGVTGTSHGFSYDDFWAVKLDAAGAIEWQQLLGGSQSDYGYEIEPTTDGGYIAIGYTWSSESGDVTGKNNSYDDIWVLKLNATGAVQWQRQLGGSGMEVGVSVRPLADGDTSSRAVRPPA